MHEQDTLVYRLLSEKSDGYPDKARIIPIGEDHYQIGDYILQLVTGENDLDALDRANEIIRYIESQVDFPVTISSLLGSIWELDNEIEQIINS